MVFDFKKQYKDLYSPKTKPSIVRVPEMLFIMIDGKGDPNTSESYQNAVEIIYGLSYSIKMSKKSENIPDGYFDYVVPPLEGLWNISEEFFEKGVVTDKSKLKWTALIRQPEFVTAEVFERAKRELAKKKPHLDSSIARLEYFEEGLCAQVMHLGSYDDEPKTIISLQEFIEVSGHTEDLSENRRHHEIYISDPRKTVSEKMKTVIRHPIA